jgi:hypothetical protein
MESAVIKILNDKKPDLSDMSVKTYANAIHKVLELIGSTSMNDLFLKAKEIITKLNEKYDKPNTRKTKIASIIVLLRCMDTPKLKAKLDSALAEYGKAVESLTGDIKKDLADGNKSDKQKCNWITEEEGSKLKADLLSKVHEPVNTAKDLMNLRNYVLFCIYEDLPSRNEIADSKLIFSPSKKEQESLSDEYNYIILDKKKKTVNYIMNSYKTAKSYGQKSISLSPDLYPILLRYKAAVDKFNGGHAWAFMNNGGDAKLTRNRLGVIYSELGKSLGKKLGTSLNRHIAISRIVPLDNMQKLADKMGSSVQEQVEVYAKK